MKRLLLSLIFVLVAFTAKAMSYEEARDQAWFLTDKMAYELNLTPDQYDRAYQINLDYLMSIQSPSDCSGYYWTYRDNDFRCILYDWQYNLYRTLDYFFHPVRWWHSAWYFPITGHYRPGSFFFDRPRVYLTYTGGMWHRRSHNMPSPYIGLRPNKGFGMRDRYHARGNAGGGFTPPRHNVPQGGDRNNNNHGGNMGRPNNDRPNDARPSNRQNDTPSNNGVRPGTSGNRNNGGINRNNGGSNRPNTGGSTSNFGTIRQGFKENSGNSGLNRGGSNNSPIGNNRGTTPNVRQRSSGNTIGNNSRGMQPINRSTNNRGAVRNANISTGSTPTRTSAPARGNNSNFIHRR